jgi:predicted alpha/beta superfamily hydrolase
MKPVLLCLIATLALTMLKAQNTNTISIGNIIDVKSAILKEQRKIWVYVPGGSAGTKRKFPVVYLLDGDAHFSSVVGMIQQLSSVNGNTICPEMIVVGIPNTDRTRDLTPTHVTGGLYMDSASSRTSGGGEHFMAFIKKELIPHIDSLYPTAPYRLLIGHSFGGLTAMNAFVHHTNLFNSYIAIDPSMWWDKQKLLHETEQQLQSRSFNGKALFLGIANTMPDGLDTASVKTDTTDATAHIRSILLLSKYLAGNKQNQLRTDYKYYNEDNHSSVPLITTYDALHFIFKDYTLHFDEKLMMDTAFKADSLFTVHYKKVSSLFGYNVLPPEDMINQWGYQFITLKHWNKAERLFKLNITNYPGSFNVYDSLGDLYAAKGDKANAITSYKQSLAIKETAETRKKLEGLTKK